MWSFFNTLFDAFKKFPIFKWAYRRFSWAPSAYHFVIALVGAALYFHQIRGVKTIGITGTKGKTTTAELLNTILEIAGKKTALLSSLRVKLGDVSEANLMGNTMPGRFFIQNFLLRAKRAGCEYAIVEVTSQGVLLHRHMFLPWAAAAITNIAPEHIEAHGSFESYCDAKLSFLLYAAKRGCRVFINRDDAPSHYFSVALSKWGVVHYSLPDLPRTPESFSEFLPGAFNAQNAVAAAVIARSLGISDEAIQEGLSAFRGVPGRMDYVQRQPFKVVVDYAHTPDSLRNVYQTLREKNPKSEILNLKQNQDSQNTKNRTGGVKLICVLGSAGGGRDKWKRPEMGKIAAEYCNEIILTNEDPWDEDPNEILNQIASGFSQATNPRLQTTNHQTVLDRKDAIKKAVGMASDGDVVIITGKGSEPYLHLENGTKIPWSDRKCVEEAIAARDKK